MNKKEWVDSLLQDLFIHRVRIEDVLGECLKRVPKRTRFYKYYSFDSDYTINNLKSDIIYFSDPTTVNDPFECNWGVSTDAAFNFAMSSIFSIDLCNEKNFSIKNICEFAAKNGGNISQAEIDQVKEVAATVPEKIRTYFAPTMGISCFSETKTDILMWAHYANKHSGICVEYDFSEIYAQDLLLFPVNYSNQRPQAPLEKIWEYTQAEDIDVARELAFELSYEVMKSFLTKSSKWKYEREWRMIIFENKEIKRKRILPCAKKIVVGNSISEEHYQIITQIVKEKNLELEKAVLSSDKFAIKTYNVKL